MSPITEFKHQYKHIVVVHGIGDQEPNETVLHFMNQFARVLPCGTGYKVEPDNLIEGVDEIVARKSKAREGERRSSFRPAFLVFTDENAGVKHVFGFSEVYWQPITNGYLKDNEWHLPIPIFTWAHSINTRLLGPDGDLAKWRSAIDNMEALLKVVKKISILSKKARDFVNITETFLGDVQFYAESDVIREEINYRFLSVLARISSFCEATRRKLGTPTFEKREIYVIAHSEGTVVSYSSLVQAAVLLEGDALHAQDQGFEGFKAGEQKRLREGPGAEAVGNWLPRVKGFLTIGSPLDKHFLIWQHRFKKYRLQNDPVVANDGTTIRIPWFNFWDQNDPVGYGLHSLFHGSEVAKTDAEKLFTLCDDRGFARYPVPGLAHVAYWDDDAIYRDIFNRVMQFDPAQPSFVVDRLKKSNELSWKLGFWLVRILVVVLTLFFGWKVLLGIAASLFYAAKTALGFFALETLAAKIPSLDLIQWKDWVGYAIGLVVSVYGWELVNRLRLGLFQVWGYTKGKGTSGRVENCEKSP